MTQPAARDKDGWYNIGDLKVPSFSVMKKMKHSTGLDFYKGKIIAEAVLSEPHLAEMVNQGDGYKVVGIVNNRSSEKAELGNAVHAAIENYENGVIEDWPDRIKGYMAGYIEAKAKYGWQVIASEQTIFNRTIGYAGTTDMFISFPPGGGVYVADIKTGKISVDIAYQLAAYANGEGIYDPITDSHQSMPVGLSLAVGFVLHVTESGTDLYALEISHALDGVVAMRWLLNDEVNPPKMTKIEPPQPVDDETTELKREVQDKLAVLKTFGDEDNLKELLARWRKMGIPTFKESQTHNVRQLRQLSDLLDDFELLDQPEQVSV